MPISHSCLDVYLTKVVSTINTFENNIRINHEFAKYSKENCWFNHDQYFSLKYFWELFFLKRYHQNNQAGLGAASMNMPIRIVYQSSFCNPGNYDLHV